MRMEAPEAQNRPSFIKVRKIARALPTSVQLRRQVSWILIAFLILVAITGGGSRGDIASLPFLRFLSACLVAFSILLIRRDELARIKVPRSLLGAITAVCLLPLVPLPQTVWTELPERGAIARIDEVLSLDAWRPISLSPAATINALASLTAPLAALLLFGMVRDRSVVLLSLVGIGIVSGLLGVLQLFSDPRSGLFLYEITNNGSAVGLFANRNHHAVFLSCCVFTAIFLMHHGDPQRFPWMRRSMVAAASFLGLAVITNASRAGLIALILALALGAFSARSVRRHDRKEKSAIGKLTPVALAAAGGLVTVLFVVAERSPALSRLINNNAMEDLRAKLWPILLSMLDDFQPWGAGMGTFEYAYRMREPVELLGPAYVNEAHNDWLQFPIEAGAAGLAIMVAGALFMLVKSISVVRRPAENANAVAGLGLLCILGAASVVDYPLRVPSVMVLAVIALAMLATTAVKEKLTETPV